MARKTRGTVRMHHPKAHRYYDAPAGAVDHWRARGWRVEGEKETAPAVKASTAKAEGTKGGN